MQKGKKLGRRRADWLGYHNLVGVKITDQELIALGRAVRASGKTRSELLRAALAHVVTQADMISAGGGAA